VVLLICLGVLVVAMLARAAWMDMRARRDGKRWIAVRSGRRFGRTRFQLVDADSYDAERREAAYAEATAERARQAAGPPRGGYLIPRLGRRTRG
jgi:hypothetical protein